MPLSEDWFGCFSNCGANELLPEADGSRDGPIPVYDNEEFPTDPLSSLAESFQLDWIIPGSEGSIAVHLT
jgi:hypothetical protein